MEDNNRVKVCIFDFCGTFVNFQTADEYIKWATSFEPYINKYCKKNRFANRCRKLKIEGLCRRLFNVSINKRIIASSIKGMGVQMADEMAESFIKNRLVPSLLPETINLLNEYKRQGCFILLVSAAYDVYLSKIQKELKFDAFVSTSLLHNDITLLGKISKDCVGKTKVKKALEYLNKKFGIGNYDIVFSIGDSKTDIPILNLAKRKVVITKSKEKWMTNGYEVILYGDQGNN